MCYILVGTVSVSSGSHEHRDLCRFGADAFSASV